MLFQCWTSANIETTLVQLLVFAGWVVESLDYQILFIPATYISLGDSYINFN